MLSFSQFLAELDNETIKSYKTKAEADIAATEPHAKKGEYKDIAKNLIARRKKGVEAASKKVD